jgi:ParB/RepB/Spo0J family partition protein
MKTAIAEPLQQVQHFETTLLQEAAWNARKTFDRASLDELIGSIEQHGIQVPLLVRNIEDDYYEVVCGHRRLKAASLAGLKTVPCIVRVLSDEQAQEIGLIDNLQRVDVPALEEADAFNELLQRLGSIAAVASKVGKEQAYVAKRLKLCTLTTWSREATAREADHDRSCVAAGAPGCGRAERCAEVVPRSACWIEDFGRQGYRQRIERNREEDEGEDDDGPSERTRYKYTWEPQSVVKLKDHIEAESGIPLDRAPWDVDDRDLRIEAGSCSECEKNTKANAPLFGDLDICVAVCTDGACFKEKTSAYVRIQTLRSTVLPGDSKNGIGVTPLRVSWKSTSTPPRIDKETGAPKRDQVFKEGQWIEVGPKEKKCEFTGPAVTVDWSDANQRGFMGSDEKLRKPGEVVQGCIEPKCKVHAKDYVRAKRTSGDGESSSLRRQTGLTAEQKKQNELAALAENKIRGELVTRAIGQVKKVEGELLRRLALRACGEWLDREDEKRFPATRRRLGRNQPRRKCSQRLQKCSENRT